MKEFDINTVIHECENLMETKRFVFGTKFKDLNVYNIPLKYLSYNKNNGRIFLGVNEKEKEGINFNDLDNESFNEEIEQLIWKYDEQKNASTMQSIHDVGQLEIALVSENGIIIDGNRRFTCLRRLNRAHKDKKEFQYLKACIIRESKDITEKDIKKYELNVQFGREVQADYHLTDKVMSIYKLVKENVLSIEEIKTEMKLSVNKVHGFIQTAEMINEFLKYYNIEDDYFMIDKMNYVNPLEVVAKYVNNGKINQELSEPEILTRRNIFFELLVGAKLHLPTQDLRDGLIRDIYKKKPQICNEFLEEYDELISQTMYELINTHLVDRDFIGFREMVTKHDVSTQMNRVWEKYKDKANIEKSLDQQINLAEKAFESVVNIDIEMLKNIDNPEAAEVYEKVKDTLRRTCREIGLIVEDNE